ncbi:MAG: BapA prefix-like domain-containing protein, partial [Burkholderiaceae bacterium]|nr:BapA prefix-like domain-containing protein [Burkholderiaceae bacterium]
MADTTDTSSMKITVIDKATHASTVVTGQDVAVDVTLPAPSIVELPIPHTEVKTLVRKGSDLIITTNGGQVITLHGYFDTANH